MEKTDDATDTGSRRKKREWKRKRWRWRTRKFEEGEKRRETYVETKIQKHQPQNAPDNKSSHPPPSSPPNVLSNHFSTLSSLSLDIENDSASTTSQILKSRVCDTMTRFRETGGLERVLMGGDRKSGMGRRERGREGRESENEEGLGEERMRNDEIE